MKAFQTHLKGKYIGSVQQKKKWFEIQNNKAKHCAQTRLSNTQSIDIYTISSHTVVCFEVKKKHFAIRYIVCSVHAVETSNKSLARKSNYGAVTGRNSTKIKVHLYKCSRARTTAIDSYHTTHNTATDTNIYFEAD